MSKNYYTVEIQTEALERIIELGDGLYDGIEEFDINEDQIDEALGKEAFVGASPNVDIAQKLSNTYGKDKYIFYFYGENHDQRLEAFLNILKNQKISPVAIHENEDQDWNKSWRESYSEIELSKDLKIVPSWEKEKYNNHSNNIYIYPGMGFGTGTHPTTFCCLELYLKHFENYENVLDLGCGSGILGIAVLLKDFKTKVDFCDVDTQALDNCVQNINLNFNDRDLSHLGVILRERLVEREYDFVFANILQTILFSEIETIKKSTKKSGKLIISGITSDQIEETISFYESHNFKKIDISQKDNWAAVLMEKA